VVLLFTIVIGGAGIPERRVGGNSNPQLFMKLDPGTLLQVRMKFHLVHVGLYPVDVMRDFIFAGEKLQIQTWRTFDFGRMSMDCQV
jgi:hypothetical protein